MAGPLDGVRIVDLSFGIAGPLATMTLCDQGAEVIKVEPPGGDPHRSYGGYTVWNRGKKSVVLDLKDAAAKDRFLELLRTADALVESFSPGVMARLGLDYDSVKGDNPELVYCSITGYGRNNRSEGRPGIDGLVQARPGQQNEQAGHHLQGAHLPLLHERTSPRRLTRDSAAPHIRSYRPNGARRVVGREARAAGASTRPPRAGPAHGPRSGPRVREKAW